MPRTEVTSEVVEQLSALPEFELTPQGEVRPLTGQNQANTSPPTSQTGEGAEAVGSPAEPQPQPTQTPQQPAPQPPRVEVIPSGGPLPAAPAATVAPAAEAEPEPSPEELAAAEQKLDAYLEEQLQTRVDAALRERQSGFDKRAAQLDRQVQEARTREQELTRQMRELQTRDLTEAERAKVLATFQQADERAELDAYRTELMDYHKSVFIDSLLLDFASTEGVTRDALEQFDSPEEMEVFCYERQNEALQGQLASGRAPVQTSAVVSPAQTSAVQSPTAVAPAQPAPQPQPNVPAGALAPTDVGGGGTVEEGKQFRQEASPDALRENLKNMRWDTVRVRV